MSILDKLHMVKVFEQNIWRTESKLPRDFLFEAATPEIMHWLDRSINVKRRLIDHDCWHVRRVFPLYLILFFVHPDTTAAGQLRTDKEKSMFDLCLIADAIVCTSGNRRTSHDQSQTEVYEHWKLRVSDNIVREFADELELDYVNPWFAIRTQRPAIYLSVRFMHRLILAMDTSNVIAPRRDSSEFFDLADAITYSSSLPSNHQ